MDIPDNKQALHLTVLTAMEDNKAEVEGNGEIRPLSGVVREALTEKVTLKLREKVIQI